MKNAVMASLVFSSVSQGDILAAGILNRIVGKPTWGAARLTKASDENNRPLVTFEVRFDGKADMEDVFNFIKSRMDAIPVLKGRLTKHACSHDEGNQPCIVQEEYIK